MLKLFLPLPDYASLQLLWKTLIERHGGTITDALDIQTLSWVAKSAGYSVGAINQVIAKVLTQRRVQRLPVSVPRVVFAVPGGGCGHEWMSQ